MSRSSQPGRIPVQNQEPVKYSHTENVGRRVLSSILSTDVWSSLIVCHWVGLTEVPPLIVIVLEILFPVLALIRILSCLVVFCLSGKLLCCSLITRAERQPNFQVRKSLSAFTVGLVVMNLLGVSGIKWREADEVLVSELIVNILLL